MYIYMIPIDADDAHQKLCKHGVFTKMLYFTLASLANLSDSLTINYFELKSVLRPRKEEEPELGRAFKFLIEAGLIKLMNEGGNG